MNIYVGNLSYEATEENLKETFEGFGHVESAKVITDMYTGRSRGFGFVEMSSPEEAEAAQKALNGFEFQGRPLKVDEARPMKKREGGGGFRGGGGGGFRNRY